MSLRCDRFIQTMLYTSLFQGSDMKDMPSEGFKIYEDGTMSFETRNGIVREVEVSEKHLGILEVKVIDVKSNNLLKLFEMNYEELHCQNCKASTIHGSNNKRLYCTECGTYKN